MELAEILTRTSNYKNYNSKHAKTFKEWLNPKDWPTEVTFPTFARFLACLFSWFHC